MKEPTERELREVGRRWLSRLVEELERSAQSRPGACSGPGREG